MFGTKDDCILTLGDVTKDECFFSIFMRGGGGGGA